MWLSVGTFIFMQQGYFGGIKKALLGGFAKDAN